MNMQLFIVLNVAVVSVFADACIISVPKKTLNLLCTSVLELLGCVKFDVEMCSKLCLESK